MKKEIVLLLLLLAMAPRQLTAQANPQKGNVITNNNGILETRNGFDAPEGAIVELEHGQII